MNENITKISSIYPVINRNLTERFLIFLNDLTLVNYIYVAGAITFDRIDDFSDLDVHCVIKNGCKDQFNNLLQLFLMDVSPTPLYTVAGRRFPWFGDLTTVYFLFKNVFYVDIGIIEESEMDDFYFQYKGIIVKDIDDRLRKNVLRCATSEKHKVERLLHFNMDQIPSALIKAYKDLQRGLFWNACENISQARRAFIFIKSYEDYYTEKFPFIGRPERDVELFWKKEDLLILNKTYPASDIDSANEKFRFLIEQTLRLNTIKSNQQLLSILKYLLAA